MLHLQLLATLNATSRRSSDGANGTSASLTAGDCQAWETFGKDTLYKAILAPNWTPYSSGRTHALVHSGAGLAGPFPSQLLDREACRMLLLQYYSIICWNRTRLFCKCMTPKRPVPSFPWLANNKQVDPNVSLHVHYSAAPACNRRLTLSVLHILHHTRQKQNLKVTNQDPNGQRLDASHQTRSSGEDPCAVVRKVSHHCSNAQRTGSGHGEIRKMHA